MTTKAIRDVLETVAAGKPLSEDAPEVARRALAELTAIREAAREVVSYKALEDWQTSMPSELATSIRLIQRIAKEE